MSKIICARSRLIVTLESCGRKVAENVFLIVGSTPALLLNLLNTSLKVAMTSGLALGRSRFRPQEPQLPEPYPVRYDDTLGQGVDVFKLIKDRLHIFC